MARRFTIYDAMQEKGVFNSNPANTYAVDSEGKSLFAGPQVYPRMMYHPEGKARITANAEIIVTPMGPKLVNQHEEIISQVVTSKEEEERLRALGWHYHPAKAIEASGKEPPPIGPSERLRTLEEEVIELKAELARRDAGAGASEAAGATTATLTLARTTSPKAN